MPREKTLTRYKELYDLLTSGKRQNDAILELINLYPNTTSGSIRVWVTRACQWFVSEQILRSIRDVENRYEKGKKAYQFESKAFNKRGVGGLPRQKANTTMEHRQSPNPLKDGILIGEDERKHSNQIRVHHLMYWFDINPRSIDSTVNDHQLHWYNEKDFQGGQHRRYGERLIDHVGFIKLQEMSNVSRRRMTLQLTLPMKWIEFEDLETFDNNDPAPYFEKIATNISYLIYHDHEITLMRSSLPHYGIEIPILKELEPLSGIVTICGSYHVDFSKGRRGELETTSPEEISHLGKLKWILEHTDEILGTYQLVPQIQREVTEIKSLITTIHDEMQKRQEERLKELQGYD